MRNARTTEEPINSGGALLPAFGSYDQSHLERYKFAMTCYRGGPILDFGCGFGFGSEFMAERVRERCIGVEVDVDALHYCTSHHSRPNLEFSGAPDGRLPVPDHSLGMITCFEVIEHLYPNQLAIFLGEGRRTLRSNGLIVGSTPNSTEGSIPTNPYHIREFEPGVLRKLFAGAGYAVDMRGQGRKGGNGVIGRATTAMLKLVPAGIASTHFFREMYSIGTVVSSRAGSNSSEIADNVTETSAHIIFIVRPQI